MSDALEIFDCPSCGGSLDAHNSVNNVVTCQYCGKNVIVPESLRAPKKQEPARIVVEYNGVNVEDYQQAAQVKAPRWVSCLIIGILAVTVLGVLAGVVVPLVMTGMIANTVKDVVPDNPIVDVNEMIDTQMTEAAQQITRVAEMAVTPTPSNASELLAFGEKGTGPGMFTDTRWIAVSPQGELYTAEYQDGRVQKFGPDGKFLLLFQAGQKAIIQDVAVTRAGVVYVTAAGKILKFDAQGQPLGALAVPGGGFAESLAATVDGGLVVVVGGEDVVRFDAREQVTLTIPDAVSSISGESELATQAAVDGLGNIYLLGRFNSAVFVYSPEGKFTNRIGSEGNEEDQIRAAMDVAVDGKGRVFITAVGGVKIFTSDGRYKSTIDIPGAGMGLAVDDANRLYVVSNAPRVMQFEVK